MFITHVQKEGKLHIYREIYYQIHSYTHTHTIHTTFMHEKLICIWGKFFDLVLTTVEPVQVIFKRRKTITTPDLLWY